MRPVLVGLLLLQLGGVVQLVNTPSQINPVFPIPLQLTITFGWIALFMLAVLRYGEYKSRAQWLVCGFILYSTLRLLFFAQADYDRVRAPFLILVSAIIVGLMFFTVLYKMRKVHQNKEIFENDG
ncbi:MAG: hypothetical protein EA396_03955 [Anaerolineaceae bacterium]|nr:MAG: hypothetical protein EA396_03955 [Anaerolineaceae bacterium]